MEGFGRKILMAKFYSTFKKSSELELSDIVLAILCKHFKHLAQIEPTTVACSLFD